MNYEIKPIPNEVTMIITSGHYSVYDYQNMVDVLFFDAGQDTALYHSGFGLLTEVGELADAYKVAHYKKQPLDLENVIEELGDIFFYYVAWISAK